MWRNIRTYIVVTLVTLLIWVWAEAETQRGDSGQQRVEVEVAELKLYVSMPAGRSERATVEPTILHKVRIRVTPEYKARINEGTTVPIGIITLKVSDLASDNVPVTVELGPPGINGRMAEPAPAVVVRIEHPSR